MGELSAGMGLLDDIAGETGSATSTDPVSAVGVRYRDALRLLFILAAGSDPADDPAEEHRLE